MTIRRATENDIEEIRALCVGTISSVNRKDYNQEETEDWASCAESLEKWKQRLAPQTYWLCELDKKITGLGSLKGGSHIGSFFVHKDYQRRGVANRIMNHIILSARELGTKKLDAEVSITAKGFFMKHGFVVIKKQQAKANNLYLTNFIMEKVL